MSEPVKRTYRCMECGVEKAVYSASSLPLRCAPCRRLVANARNLARLKRNGPKNATEERIMAVGLRAKARRP